MKICSNKECKQINPQQFDRFSAQKDKKDGFRSQCKACINEKTKNLIKTEESRKRAANNTAKYRSTHKEELNKKREELKKDPNFKLRAAQATAKYRANHPDLVIAQNNRVKTDPELRAKARLATIEHRKKDPEGRRKRDNERNAQPENKRKRRINAKKYRLNNLGKDCAKSVKRYAAKINRIPKWLTKDQKNDIIYFYEYCASIQHLSIPGDPFQVDHIVPLQGEETNGLHVRWNLQILPRSLNVRKGNKILNTESEIYRDCENFQKWLADILKNKSRPTT